MSVTAYDIGAETALLGGMMMAPAVIAACEELNPTHFSQPHDLIFSAIAELHRTGKPVLPRTVTTELQERGKLEAAGGAVYVSGLPYDGTTGAASAAYFVSVVRAKWEHRRARDIASHLHRDMENGGTLASFDEAMEALGKLRAQSSGPHDILAVRRFNLASPPPKPRPIYTLAGATVATQGNIQAITGQAKSGKSALLSGFMASTMTPTGDTLGVSSSNPDGAAVLHIDTEQSRYDHHHAILQALRRAGRQAPPEWLYSYSLADVTIGERLRLLRHQLDAARKVHGAIHSAIIDGIGDLCYDPNDSKEAFALVAELHKLAIDFDTTILCVLHENPGSETGKTRGHLGSQLERKAESNLRMTKDADGITTVYTSNSRHASISKPQGPRFAWNDEAAMHLTAEDAATVKDSARREELMDVAVEVFRDTPATLGLTWEQLHQRIEAAEGLKRGGSRKRFAAMKKTGVIRQIGEKYRLA